MSPTLKDCCVLNAGSGAWAFESVAIQLSAALQIDLSSEPRCFNYLIQMEDIDTLNPLNSFIPLESIRLASDKRLLASVFNEHNVPTPLTFLYETFHEASAFVGSHADKEWCLKYPTSCGANGHRLFPANEPRNWPRPFVVQEFVRLETPEVYRIYCAGGELFGWMARRFPDGTAVSPWVAHARGARYISAGVPPLQAITAARSALIATKLFDSFGCVDLLRNQHDEWLVLEVGTDGLFNCVDRDLNDPQLERELLTRIADAFEKWVANSSAS